MQIIMYARRKYDAKLIQKVNTALSITWQDEELDLIFIFDTSSSLFCEEPTMVRIFTPKDNKDCVLITNLSSPIKSSHYDALRLFQHFESKRYNQLIFIEECKDNFGTGDIIIKKLLQSCDNLIPSRRRIPDVFNFLKDSFSIFYQQKRENVFIDNLETVNSRAKFIHHSATCTLP